MWAALLLLAPQVAPSIEADPLTLRLVCFGDSSTYQRRDSKRAWPARLGDLLRDRYPEWRIEAENAGRPGDTTEHALARLERDVLSRDADVVLVQFGVNDAAIEFPKGAIEPAVDVVRYGANLVTVAERVEATGARLVLLEPGAATWTPEILREYARAPYRPDDPWGFDHLLVDYAAVVTDVAEERGLPLIPVHRADRERGPEVTGRWRTDGRHPTDEAHAWLAGEAFERITAELAAERLTPRPFSAHRAVSRGFTIPQRDLTGAPTALVSGDLPPTGAPTLTALADGSLLCAYPVAADSGRLAVRCRHSRDGGETWQAAAAPQGTLEPGAEISLVRMGDTLLLLGDRFPAHASRSLDGGATWTDLAPLEDEESRPFGAQGFARGARSNPDGTRSVVCFDDGRFAGPTGKFSGFELLEVTLSADAKRWSLPRRIARSDYAYWALPCLVAGDATPRLLFAELGRQSNSWTMAFEDGAWTEPREVAGALTGAFHRAARLADGRWLITFQDRGHDTPTPGAGIGWIGSADDIACGRQGEFRIVLFDEAGSRPVSAVTREGGVVVATLRQSDRSSVFARRLEQSMLDW